MDTNINDVLSKIEENVARVIIGKEEVTRLMLVNPSLAKQARAVLDVNKSERHIRGGLATREKYLHKSESAG